MGHDALHRRNVCLRLSLSLSLSLCGQPTTIALRMMMNRTDTSTVDVSISAKNKKTTATTVKPPLSKSLLLSSSSSACPFQIYSCQDLETRSGNNTKDHNDNNIVGSDCECMPLHGSLHNNKKGDAEFGWFRCNDGCEGPLSSINLTLHGNNNEEKQKEECPSVVSSCEDIPCRDTTKSQCLHDPTMSGTTTLSGDNDDIDDDNNNNNLAVEENWILGYYLCYTERNELLCSGQINRTIPPTTTTDNGTREPPQPKQTTPHGGSATVIVWKSIGIVGLVLVVLSFLYLAMVWWKRRQQAAQFRLMTRNYDYFDTEFSSVLDEDYLMEDEDDDEGEEPTTFRNNHQHCHDGDVELS